MGATSITLLSIYRNLMTEFTTYQTPYRTDHIHH